MFLMNISAKSQNVDTYDLRIWEVVLGTEPNESFMTWFTSGGWTTGTGLLKRIGYLITSDTKSIILLDHKPC